MATVGTILRQGDSDTMVFRTTSAETGGAYVEVEATYASMRDCRPPVHCHPKQDEHFAVLDGQITIEVDGSDRVLTPGQSAGIARGIYHTMWNSGDEPARFIWRTTPALRTESLFETLWELAADGNMGRHGTPPPNLLQSAVLYRAYRDEYRLKTPHRFIASPVCCLLRPLSHALGYRAVPTADRS